MPPDRPRREPPAFAISARALRKVYRAPGGGHAEALKGIDLDIPRGTIFGLLGPNGAGKSSFINILAGLVRKTSGQAVIWDIDIDQDPRGARGAIGVVPQELVIDPFFTARETLELYAGYYGVPGPERRTDEILDAIGLTAQASVNSRSLSGGMRRRLLIGKALVHSPPIVVLDEPTAGVDVELREQLWNYARQLNAEGVTVLLTTHYLEEAEQLCDWIAIIDHGALIACETTRSLVDRLDWKELVIHVGEPLDGPPPALAGYDVELVERQRLFVRYSRSETQIGDVLNALQEAGISIVDLSTTDSDLEDVFRELTRKMPPGGDAGA